MPGLERLNLNAILTALYEQGLRWRALSPGEPCESPTRLYVCIAAHDGERVRRYPIASADLPAAADLNDLRRFAIDALRMLEVGKAKDYGNQNTKRTETPRTETPRTETNVSSFPITSGNSPERQDAKPQVGDLVLSVTEQMRLLLQPGLPQPTRNLIYGSVLSALSLLFLTHTMTDWER